MARRHTLAFPPQNLLAGPGRAPAGAQLDTAPGAPVSDPAPSVVFPPK